MMPPESSARLCTSSFMYLFAKLRDIMRKRARALQRDLETVGLVARAAAAGLLDRDQV